MRLVIDATVAVDIALAGGDLGPLAGHELQAPALMWSEATSVIRELAYRAEIPASEAPGAVDILLGLQAALVTLDARLARGARARVRVFGPRDVPPA